VNLLNYIIIWSCIYQHTSVGVCLFVIHVGSNGTNSSVVLSLVWMESSCNFMKLILHMWVAYYTLLASHLLVLLIICIHCFVSEMLSILLRMIWLWRWMSSQGKSVGVWTSWYKHFKLNPWNKYLIQIAWSHAIAVVVNTVVVNTPLKSFSVEMWM
jgi:hypothetical protein